MKSIASVTGQVKRLHNITRFGIVLMTVTLAASSACAVSASLEKEVGNSWFGAKATLGFTDYVLGDMYRATISANVVGKLVRTTVPLVSGNSSLRISQPSNCRAYGTLKLGGSAVASWDKSFSGSANFATAPLPFTGAELKTTWSVPLPWLPDPSATLTAKAKITAYAKGSVQVAASPSTGLPVVTGTIGPVMDAAAAASLVLRPGPDASASIKLVGGDLIGKFTYASRPTGHPAVSYCVKATIEGTQGTLSAGPVEFAYGGGRQTYTLACGSLSL